MCKGCYTPGVWGEKTTRKCKAVRWDNGPMHQPFHNTARWWSFEQVMVADLLLVGSCSKSSVGLEIIEIVLRARLHFSTRKAAALISCTITHSLRQGLWSLHDAEKLVCAFASSSLDNCNALLSECSSRCMNKLQLVQKAAVKDLTRYYASIIKHSHWPRKHWLVSHQTTWMNVWTFMIHTFLTT